MDLRPADIKSKKIVGKLRKGSQTVPVLELKCKGGLNILVSKDGDDPQILGAGSHPAISRLIAQRQHNVTFTDLNKGNYVEPETIAAYIPEFEELTARMQKAFKK